MGLGRPSCVVPLLDARDSAIFFWLTPTTDPRQRNPSCIRIAHHYIINEFMFTKTWRPPCSGSTISECTANGYSFFTLIALKSIEWCGCNPRRPVGCSEACLSHCSTFGSLAVRPSNSKLALIILTRTHSYTARTRHT